MTVSLSGWVNNVAWSPNSKFAFVATHDANLTVINTETKTNSTINLKHSPINFIIPVNNNSICVISFDRHIYQYVLDTNTNTWSYKKCITKEDSSPSGLPSSLSSISNTSTRPSISSEGGMGSNIQERLKQLQGLQKKQSLIVTTTVQRNIHSANVNSANLVNERFIVTSDYAGFIKIWNI